MNKALLLAAVSLMASTSANAGTTSGAMYDPDYSATQVTYSASTSDDQFEDAGATLNAKFTMSGKVTKTCAIQGVDSDAVGLDGHIDLGTIGITAGDDQSLASQFTMSGPAHVTIHSGAAGCNYRNTVTLTKDSVDGLRNTTPVSYDSNQFQANIPYEVSASFTGVDSSGTGRPGTAQTLGVDSSHVSNSAMYGAWRSPLDLNVNIPAVTAKGIVGGTYQGTVTLTLAVS